MFQIGDYIVYPTQGAGVIEAIEEKEVLGEKRPYYIIKMKIVKMQVMIPLGKEKNARIRIVSDDDTLEEVMDVFHYGETNTKLSMKERYKINTEKLKTGVMKDGAEVVRDLLRINKKKSLNSSEKQMLESARKIFIGELGLIKGLTDHQAADMLNDQVS
ncbi:CarD family transcriptional regulator [Bacillus sp. FJAT-29814]|uniref:CarD family transcriptional regulator n=1 Tax=Bacillus sp. FJAT-29814 TaxID=1729688 RepID=UPI00083561B2|nr:CarD family transcriptional regulator [Bacillus sp. FJAT-29814]